jgi:MFS transporter, NNP family, nitrate/nitrite transporter
LTEVQHSLQLTKREVWTSSIFGVAGSAMTRILIGPICDKYGARWAMTGTLLMSAIPTAFLGVVQTARGLNVLRLMIGVAGSAFVTCQYWTSSMFSREVAGTANALVAGWGNLGGGVTQIVMGSLLFPLFKVIYGGDLHADGEQQTPQDLRAADLAWRTVCVVPAILCVVIAYLVVKYSDDSPMGNYQKRNRQGFKPSVSARWSLQRAFSNLNTWILAVQYGCCFGVEITMVNAAALCKCKWCTLVWSMTCSRHCCVCFRLHQDRYTPFSDFKEEFDLSTESAAAIASIFGWMNLFARGMGGFASDIANAKLGMRGRLWVQSIFLVLEGAMVILFSSTRTLAGSICVMVVFSVLVSAAEGSTFGIVTYVHPVATGSIAGVVGAGGNVGGVAFSILCREYDYRQSFTLMGWVVMSSAVLTGFIRIQGHASLCSGKDAPEVTERRNNHTEKYGTLPNVALKAPVDGGQSFRGGSVARAEVLESASSPSS